MGNNVKPKIRNLGVEVTSVLTKYFFDSDHLHYGYWPEDLQVKKSNVCKAQEHYSNLILTHIPGTVRTILDVGCGAGKFAEVLLDNGYEVDCVSPSKFLTEKTHALLGDRIHIYESRFEDIQTNRTYDLILFSESFQYIHVVLALNKSIELMTKDAYLLICDFFRRDVAGESPIKGGHLLSKYYDIVQSYPLKGIKDLDVTKETAPSLDIINDLLTNVELPVLDLVRTYLNHKRPFIAHFINWIFRNKIDDLLQKHHSTNRESFIRFKSYHLLLYQIVKQTEING